MKHIGIVFLLFLLFWLSGKSLAQQNFEWETLIEGLEGNKNQLYSKTEFWLANSFVSSREVIQLSDKENDIIVVKGKVVPSIYSFPCKLEYDYKFSMTFRFKDGRCKSEINGVYCTQAICHYNGIVIRKLVVPYDQVPDKQRDRGDISKKKYLELMTKLKNRLQQLTDNYTTYMKVSEVIDENDW